MMKRDLVRLTAEKNDCRSIMIFFVCIVSWLGPIRLTGVRRMWLLTWLRLASMQRSYSLYKKASKKGKKIINTTTMSKHRNCCELILWPGNYQFHPFDRISICVPTATKKTKKKCDRKAREKRRNRVAREEWARKRDQPIKSKTRTTFLLTIRV